MDFNSNRKRISITWTWMHYQNTTIHEARTHLKWKLIILTRIHFKWRLIETRKDPTYLVAVRASELKPIFVFLSTKPTNKINTSTSTNS